MAFALVANVASGTDSDGTTTSTIDTTGATLLVAHGSYVQGGSVTMADSKGNTWNARTERNAAASFAGRMFYATTGLVGTGHTFSLTGVGTFPSVYVEAFSGTSPSFDQESGAGGAGAPVQPGSLTPPQNDSLFVCGLADAGGATDTINSSFITTNGLDVSGGNFFGGALAYLIQGTAAAVNPTWSTGGGNWATEMLTFIEGAGAPATVTSRAMALLGVGKGT